MRMATPVFRACVWLASTSLALTSAVPAWAQPAPPAGEDQANAGGGDPPALAGRLSDLHGTVSFHGSGEDHWDTAQLNYPVTAGESFWTEPQADATIEIGSDRVVLAGATEMDVTALDQSQFVATLAQGAMYLELTDLPNGQGVTINTPRGTVQITAVGRYEIVGGDTNDATTVTVVDGQAHVTGPGLDLQIGAQQMATITGTDTFQGQIGAMQPDEFLQAQLNRAAPQAPQAAPRQVAEMTGGAELAQYGNWQQSADYGQVWYPNNVASDWTPYRDGHWNYVAPWGWTWVDAEPWGFAPFHYGRWVDVGNRWGWVAAAPDAPYGAYPVYAPALVSFVDVAGAALAGFAAGALVGGAVGWVPLGFREPYYPWYHTSEGYLRNVNRVSVVNVTNIRINNYRNVTINRYANARGATVMPASAMVRADRVRGIGRPLPAGALAQARPVVGRLPVRPTAATPHLTPAVARRYDIARPAGPARVAPGPQIRPVAAGPAARPSLRPAALPPHVRPVPVAGVHPGAPGARPGVPTTRPGVPTTRPGAPGPAIGARPGLPPLRGPGEINRRPPAIPAPGVRPAPVPGETRPTPGTRPEPRPAPTPPGTRPALPAPGGSRPEPVRPTPRPEPARPTPRPEPVRPAPRPEPARPAPRPEPVRPAPRPEPARPAPRPEPVRPAPRPAAPRPEPRPAPPPRPEVRPPPRPEAPRPMPRPAAPAPRPAPRPAPPPHPAAPAPDRKPH